MRLLHYNALGNLDLTDFRGKRIPPYAILSHRWSDSEILFEEIRSEAYKEKKEGYKKLQFCAKQAARDGLQYFWIDTCCINAWSNDERSNAINLMFQWYKNAARCYVFLSDVSVATTTGLAQRSECDALLRASEWFTRGWTLQELIAPASVEFFSREGRRLGDKTSINELLHDITGIPHEALRNCPLDQFSTSERMQWVKKRETTEEEDMVYCLLGLLNVSMPTTYGEGRESALERLQAEILGAGTGPSIIPFSRNKFFVGRKPQLANIEAKLFSNKQNTTALAIVGPGGTGKSQLALEVAHRTRQNNTDCAVFWMNASDEDSLYQSYASVARKLNIPGMKNNSELANMKQIVKDCVAELSERQCLLVFDNVDDTTLLFTGLSTVDAAGLAEYLPQSTRCSVIFTTTSTEVAQTLAPQNVVALHELTPEAALRMLQNSLSRPLTSTEQQQSIPLLRELSHLPIAVVQAAACMRASDISVQEYATQLNKHKGVVDEYNDEHRQQDSSLESPAAAAALFLTISQVRYRNTIAADYLFIAACVDRKDIALDLFEAPTVRAREDAIKMLDKYALVTRRPDESAVDVHRLVHDALRVRLQAQGELQHWKHCAITRLAQVFPNDDHSNRSKWRRLLPHAQFVLSDNERNDDDEQTNLAENCARALESDGQYKKAEELFVQVVETRRRILDSKHPNTLTSVSNLGSVLSKQGKYKEAEAMHRRDLEGSEKVLGREHPDTLTSVSNLGSVLSKQGKYKEAEAMHRRALDGYEKVLGREHPYTLTSVSNLGSVLESQGKYREAEAMHRRDLEGYEKVLGREHPDTLTSVSNLGSVLSSQGKYKEAEAMYRQDLEGSEKVLGREHPDTLTSVSNLGSVLSSQGKYREAEAMHRRALEARERVLGRKHPNTLTSVYCLAYLLAKLHTYGESLALYNEACDGYTVVLGEHHPTTRACYQHRSEVLALQEQS